MQVTIMNDRSQGATILEDGSMEFMINRRLLGHDSGAVNEPLNETNSSGEGLQVNTRFRLQYFKITERDSLQRRVQRLTDEPLQLFAAKSTSENAPKASASGVPIPSFDGELKIHLFPQAKNEILIRLENLADLFDKTPESAPQFDLGSYATNLYMASSGKEGMFALGVTITERGLSNNQDYEDMLKAKPVWKTVDGPSNVTYPADEKPNSIVALQPQRIRLFRVQYSTMD